MTNYLEFNSTREQDLAASILSFIGRDYTLRTGGIHRLRIYFDTAMQRNLAHSTLDRFELGRSSVYFKAYGEGVESTEPVTA